VCGPDKRRTAEEETDVYKNILIATDGSDLSASAIKQGISLATGLAARVTAVSVTEPFHWFDPNMVDDAESAYARGASQIAAKALAAVTDAAKAAGVACETIHVEEAQPYKAIIDTAKARNCDLIVMASHGRKGVSALVLGSETVKVLTHTGIPVLVCH
jgi:nucleotide-binding universal stress UspA family protein